jgi:hypothetical protein
MPTADVVDIRYLFRFRDLIANTIDAHRTVIQEHGNCWWGWWKRPTEGSRDDVWKPLAATATVTAPVPVGLFDSGSGTVYIAHVSRVIPPSTDPQAQVAVPAGEGMLVPEYYRSSPFSRAWMQFVAMSEPIEFFEKYSFEEAPAVPDYNADVLSRFRDKVIKTGQELRGMDTTIWRVRPRRQTDLDEEIILSTRLLSHPIASESRDLQASTILHITDPHFALGTHRDKHVWALESETGRGRPTMVEAIQQAVSDRKIGLVVITGDFTFMGLPEEFIEAAAAINRLLGLLNLDKDRLVVIPGNHDIRWTKADAYDQDAKVTEAPSAAKANYEAFYRQMYGHEANPTLSMGRRYTLPSGLVLEICALNSSSLETGPKFLAGMGRVEEAAFNKVAGEFQWAKPNLTFRLLALHHHLVLVENKEAEEDYYRGYGLAIDAPRVLRMAARNGVHLVLHGHKHRAFVWSSSVYELPEHTQTKWQLGDVAVVGGGSSGSIETEANNNYFNLLEFRGTRLLLDMYRASNAGGFDLMAQWESPLSVDDASERLRMADWQRRPAEQTS